MVVFLCGDGGHNIVDSLFLRTILAMKTGRSRCDGHGSATFPHPEAQDATQSKVIPPPSPGQSHPQLCVQRSMTWPLQMLVSLFRYACPMLWFNDRVFHISIVQTPFPWQPHTWIWGKLSRLCTSVRTLRHVCWQLLQRGEGGLNPFNVGLWITFRENKDIVIPLTTMLLFEEP